MIKVIKQKILNIISKRLTKYRIRFEVYELSTSVLFVYEVQPEVTSVFQTKKFHEIFSHKNPSTKVPQIYKY